MLISPSADLVYLTGYAGHASERPTLLAVPREGPARILLPQLEALRFPALPEVDIVPYDETEDPYRRLDEGLGGGPPGSVAISDQAWAAVLMRLQEAWPAARYSSATPVLRELRMRKSADEVEAMARAGKVDDDVFPVLLGQGMEGRTEREVGLALEGLLRDGGLMEVWQIVASGPNSASPHHFSSDRVIRSGDAVVLDYGGALNGYQADITRTVHVGKAADEFTHVYEVVRQAQEAAIRAIAPGAPAESVDQAARTAINAAGYGDFFIHRTGHGIGLDVHEEPYIVSGNDLVLEPGMTFSVEPGVYLPGRFGVRIEDIVAVTDFGVRRLNKAPRELIVV
jgi:Xaa-Pro aminopeptidase